MQTIRQSLFTGWHLMRILRLIFGIFFLVQAIQIHDVMIGVIAGFFLITAITNVGCCGARSCAVPGQKETGKDKEKINLKK